MLNYLPLTYFLLIATVFGVSKSRGLNLTVIDGKTRQEVSTYLVKNANEPLELTCKVTNSNDDHISLSWVLPFTEPNGTLDYEEVYNDTSTYMMRQELPENGSIKLYVNSLQTHHSGSLTCAAISNSSGTQYETVKLFVKAKKVMCGKKFDCGDNQCISIIYKCDGVADCKSKSDESPDICGINPCEGRMICNNGRCIPTEWCKVCDPLKMNCTNRHRHDCCPSLEVIAFTKGLMPYSDGSYSRRFSDFPDSNIQHQYDINFIHSTIYTIIGCAIVFMIIVTILVLAMCRVYWKRPPSSHLPCNRRVFSTTAYHRAFTQEIGVCDLDLTMNRSDGTSGGGSSGPGFLVTYNINNGVQIVGNPVEPPPYSEVASLPPREGPPPPYAVISPPPAGDCGDGGVRSVQCETSPKPATGRRHPDFRRPSGALSPRMSRIASEPSLASPHSLSE